MKKDWLTRTEILIGEENLKKLQDSRVTIVGLGGVGSHAAESLVRAGIGEFHLIDYDTVSVSNINRQILATSETVGRLKTEVMKERMHSINPEVKISIYSEFLQKNNRLQILKNSDYIVDAIDTIGPKMGMIYDLIELDIPFISVLGAGNRVNPETIKIKSIWETTGCPFAKRIKKLLRKRGVSKDFVVVFSEEEPISIVNTSAGKTPKCNLSINLCRSTNPRMALSDGIWQSEIAATEGSIPKSIVGSISYMPAIMGMVAASKVIRDIIKN